MKQPGNGIQEARLANLTHAIPKIDIAAFCTSSDVAAAIKTAAMDRRMARATVAVKHGGVADAAAFYSGTSSPNLVVVEANDDKDHLMADLAALALECITGTKVIVVGRSNDVDLYRELLQAGVSDYIVAPFEPMAFVTAVSRSFRTSAEDKLGRITAFMGAKGGTGSSTVAHNVAAALAERGDTDVLVADLDLQFGTLGLNYDIDSPQGMADVLEAAGRVDEVLLARLAVKRAERLHLLQASGDLNKSFNVKEEDADRLLDIARSSSWHLIVDLPHIWTQWTKKTLLSADEIVITATPELASMRNAKNMIEFLKKARPNDAPPRLVLNKIGVPKSPEIKLKDFAAAVGVEESICIPFDPQLFGKAANDGRMIVESARNSKPARAMSDLAGRVSSQKDKMSRKPFSLQGLLGSFKRQRSKSDLKQKVKDLGNSNAGVSAVEFALVAPVLALALVAMADVGLALYERMTIDHVLRAGAQAAMSDPGEKPVLNVLQSTLSQSPTPSNLTFDMVKRYCACPEDADVEPASAPACGTVTCANSAPQYVYYRMAASKTYEAMSLPEVLPDFQLSSSVQVQVR
jgi:pilus assembly protein CpaE